MLKRGEKSAEHRGAEDHAGEQLAHDGRLPDTLHQLPEQTPDEQLRGMIVALFMPVFFGLAGLSADLRVISTPMMGLITLSFIVIASVGKFAGAFAGGALGGLSSAESLALACGMNARGSTEVIVATIGLAVGALDTMLFTMIVAMAVVTTLLMPPMLRWAFSRIPMAEDERQLLERAEFEQRGFVARLERVLLATDDSPSARLASYLVGLISAPRGMPVTALAPDRPGPDSATERHLEEVREVMEQAAVRTAQAEAVPGDAAPEIDLIARRSAEPAENAVAREARKGYDLLVIGMEPLTRGDTELSPRLARLTQGFERAICLVSARGRDARDPASASRRILLPVIGEAYSRDAADLALTLAQTGSARVTALYVATGGLRATWRRRLSRSFSLVDAADSILRDVLDLSRHYSVQLHTTIVSHAVPEKAVLSELASGGHDLIVLGTLGARPGDSAFPGGTAAALLQRAPCSIVLLAS